MKKTMLALCVMALVLSVVLNSAFAMTYEEIMEEVKKSDATYEMGSPLTKEDFIILTTNEDFKSYDYDMLNYLKEYDWEASYPNTSENMEIMGLDHDPSIFYTPRGISTDDRGLSGHEVDPSLYSKETVIARYGIGLEGTFDSNTDIVYKFYNHPDYGDAWKVIAKSKTWLLYNYQDIAQIQFYFDAEDNISQVVWYDGIQVTADKETTKTIQEYLNENGYDCGKPDGIAGNATKAALKRFQEDHDLFPSGYIDDCLMKYLDAQNNG